MNFENNWVTDDSLTDLNNSVFIYFKLKTSVLLPFLFLPLFLEAKLDIL